jgi:uncharacterized membrane-anchored protein YitT (DUF2179 family)
VSRDVGASSMFPLEADADIATIDPARRHTLVEDAYALVIGCVLITLGLVLLKAAGLITGGVAGIALLLSYVVPWSVGVLFTLINIPFFALAQRVLGTRFAVKTILVNLGITAMSVLTPGSLHIVDVGPVFAALVGGTVIGMGVLSLARHGAGVGGTGVLTMWALKMRGWNPGRTQLACDVAILLAALTVLPPSKIAYSALSAAAMSLVLIAWHRPDRYIAH